jgi:hypothetical protein
VHRVDAERLEVVERALADRRAREHERLVVFEDRALHARSVGGRGDEERGQRAREQDETFHEIG